MHGCVVWLYVTTACHSRVVAQSERMTWPFSIYGHDKGLRPTPAGRPAHLPLLSQIVPHRRRSGLCDTLLLMNWEETQSYRCEKANTNTQNCQRLSAPELSNVSLLAAQSSLKLWTQVNSVLKVFQTWGTQSLLSSWRPCRHGQAY